MQEWDYDLATVAQNHSEMCIFDPNPDRAAQAPFDTVGENRAFGRSTNYTDLIERGLFVQHLRLILIQTCAFHLERALNTHRYVCNYAFV